MRPIASQGLRPILGALAHTPLSVSTISTRIPSSRLFSTRLFSPRSLNSASPLPRPARILTQTHFVRQNSTSSPSRPLTEKPSGQTETDAEREKANEERRKNEEAYRIAFTCKPCGHRSTHRMSKQGYHRGTVLIQCPSCQSRHVMSDHLGIFFDKKTTLEDILQEKGQTLTHGYTDGNMEFWDDGTVKSFDLEGGEKLGSSGNGQS